MKNRVEYNEYFLHGEYNDESAMNDLIINPDDKVYVKCVKQRNPSSSSQGVVLDMIENFSINEVLSQNNCNNSPISSQIMLFDKNSLSNSTSLMELNYKKYDNDDMVIWLYKCTIDNNSWRPYSIELSNMIESNYRNRVRYFLHYPFVFNLSSFKQIDLVTGKESYLLRNRNNTEFYSPFFFEYTKATNIYLIEKMLNYIKYDNFSLFGNINRVFDYCKYTLKPHFMESIGKNGRKIKRSSKKTSSSFFYSIDDSSLFPGTLRKPPARTKDSVKSRKMILNTTINEDSSSFNDYLGSNKRNNEDDGNNMSSENASNFAEISDSFYLNSIGTKNTTKNTISGSDCHEVPGSGSRDQIPEKEDAREFVNIAKYGKHGSNSCFLFTPHNYRKGLGIIVPKLLSYKWNKKSRMTEKDKSKYVRFNFGLLSPEIHKKCSGVKSCYIGTPRRGVGRGVRNTSNGTISGPSYNGNINSKRINFSESQSSSLNTNATTPSVFLLSQLDDKTSANDFESRIVVKPMKKTSSSIHVESRRDFSLQSDASRKIKLLNIDREVTNEQEFSSKSIHSHSNLSVVNKSPTSIKLMKEAEKKVTPSRRKNDSSTGNYTHLLEIEDWIFFDAVFGCESRFKNKTRVGRDKVEFSYKSKNKDLLEYECKKSNSINDERLKDWYYYYHCSTDTDGYCYGNDEYNECDIYMGIEEHKNNNVGNNIKNVDIGIEIDFQSDYNSPLTKDEFEFDDVYFEDDESHRSIRFEDLNDFLSGNYKTIKWWFNHSIKHVTVNLNSFRNLDSKASPLYKNNKKAQVDIIPLIHPLLTGYLNELDICESSILFSNTITPSSIKILETQSKVLLGLKSVNVNGLKPRKSEFSSISEFCFKEANNIVPISLIEFKIVHSTIPISLFSMLLTRFPVPAANTFLFSFICNDDNIPNTGMQTVHILDIHLSQKTCNFHGGNKRNKFKNSNGAKNILNNHSCNHIHLDVFRRYNKVKICPWLAISNFIDEFVLRTPILVKCIIDMHNIMIIPSKKRYSNSGNNESNKFLKLNNPKDGVNESEINYDKNYVEFVILTASLLLPLLIINSHSIQNIIIGPDNNDLSRGIHNFDGKSLANLRIDSMIFTKKCLPFTFYNIRNFDLCLDHNIDKTEIGVFISGRIKNLTGNASASNDNKSSALCFRSNISKNRDFFVPNSHNLNYLDHDYVGNVAVNKTNIENFTLKENNKLNSEFDNDPKNFEGFSEKLFNVIYIWINEFLSWFDKYVSDTIENLKINLYLTSGYLEAKNFCYNSIVNEKLCSELDSEFLTDFDLLMLKQKFILNSKTKHPLLNNVSFNIFISNHLKLFIISQHSCRS
ncbi:WWE domain [Cryptosporidium ryanae]|uniref:WWE domain n=1 Tax=Cryptosporidium ryanae TaxID=515981 RepID=UPI00351A156E|nr:WWE domain [Cryptosporidium ryanae]